ncbi:MAG TPA: hypothetical protein VN604_05305, partial [Nitrospirota bacterium]|nr:hypothetical protein [Nitrospirota bacterium]
MAQLDKLVEKLQDGQEILLESGKEPTIRTAAGLQVLVKQQLLTQQILSLLAEIAPPPAKTPISQKKPSTFSYPYKGKKYAITLMVQGDAVRATITIPDGAAAAVEEESATDGPDASPSPAPKPHAGPEPEINGLLRKMFQMGCSDLHLTSNHKPIVRLHGDMMELPNQGVISHDRVRKLISAIMPPHNATQFEETHDTDFAHEIEGLARFRVNIFRDRFGIGAVFRQIPMEIVTAEKLGLTKSVLDLCFLSKGLVLVTG